MHLCAIGYGRTSANLAVLSVQKRAVEAYAQQNSMTIVAFHHDLGLAGGNAVGEGLSAAIADMKASGTSIFIVEDISRLGRDWSILSQTLEALRAQNVVIHEVVSARHGRGYRA